MFISFNEFSLSYKYLSRSFVVAIILLSSTLPLVVKAETPGGPIIGGGGCALTDFEGLVECINSTIVSPLIALAVGIALVVFLWGVVKYIAEGDKPEEKKKGLVIIGWGIVGLFVMVSVWGLVKILTTTFFGGTVPSSPPIPTLNL